MDSKNVFSGVWTSTEPDRNAQVAVELSESGGLEIGISHRDFRGEFVVADLRVSGSTLFFQSTYSDDPFPTAHSLCIRENGVADMKITFQQPWRVRSAQKEDCQPLLCGSTVWECSSDDTTMILYISEKDGVPRSLKAIDELDSEDFEISSLRFSDRSIFFSTYMASTGHHAENHLKIRPDGKSGIMFLTAHETWVRVRP